MGHEILHVDDNPSERLLILEAVHELGVPYDLAGAQDGYQALRLLDQGVAENPPHRPELILCDINMPRMSGLELLALLKQHREWRSIPVIMLTSSQRSEERDAAVRLGSQGFETKPTDFPGYIALVRRLIANPILQEQRRPS